MKNKTQILFISGGMTFKNQDNYLDFLKNREISIDEKISWNGNYLKEELKDYCKIIKPRMPLQDNAKYEEWKIHFERHFEYLNDEIILIGSSLGGVFLSKYLSENKFPKRLLLLRVIFFLLFCLFILKNISFMPIKSRNSNPTI